MCVQVVPVQRLLGNKNEFWETQTPSRWAHRVPPHESKTCSTLSLQTSPAYRPRAGKLSATKTCIAQWGSSLILSLSLETLWCIHLPPWAIGMSRARCDSKTGHKSYFELKHKCPHPALRSSGGDRCAGATAFPTGALVPGFPKLRLNLCLFINLLEEVWPDGWWVRPRVDLW